MNSLDRVLLVPLALAACLCAPFAARLAERAGLRAELGRRRVATVSAETRARLAALDEDVVVTWYRTPPERMPPHLRRLEDGVPAALAALRDASGGRLAFEVQDPEAHPEWQGFLAAVGVAPWRARRVERDGWREDTVWSSLRVTCGPRAGVVLNGLAPEHLPDLQRLVLAYADELRAPRRPRIALSAGAGFERLRAALAARGDVQPLDLDAAPGELAAAGADLLLWLDPRACDARHLTALERHLARGGSAVVAGSALRAAVGGEGPLAALRVERGPFPAARLFDRFGLRAVDALVLDAASEPWTDAAGGALSAPHRLRALPGDQDFRTFRGQPNGALLFVAPTAFEPDPERLAELGLEARVLASTTDGAVTVPVPDAPLPLGALALERGAPRGRLALAAAVRGADPWRGTLVVLGAADPFRDTWASSDRYAHEALAAALLDTLLAPERLVAARVALAAPPPLEELGAGARLFWRALAVGLAPAALALLFLARRLAAGGERARRRRPALGLAAAAVLALGGALALARAAPEAALDFTRDGRNHTTGPERERLARWTAGGARLELVFSADAELSPELRAGARAARRLCDELARALPGLEVVRVPVGVLDDATRSALAELGVATHLARSTREEQTRVRRVASALRVVRGGRAEVLELPDPAAFDALRFRVAFALWRLSTGGAGRVALAAAPPRLSPAEVALEYQQQGLFAPREGDAYSALAALLAANDFEVRRVDPAAAPELAPDELLFWLQPRRDVLPMLASAARHLAAGGRAVVAAQHFRVLARQLAANELALGFWPQPQFCDLERHYLPALGLELVREVLFDRNHAALDVTTRVDRADGTAAYVPQPVAEPFLLRAAEADRPADAVELAGLGDLALPGGNRIALDAALLSARGLAARPWVRTGPRPWSYAWSGGELPPQLLDPAAAAALPGATPLAGAQALAVHVTGRFPGAGVVEAADGARALALAEPDPDAPAGALLLVGGSELFQNGLLDHPGFRHDLFALRAAAELALGPQLARFLRRRAAPPGLGQVAPGARAVWRAAVLGGFPALLALALLLRRLAR